MEQQLKFVKFIYYPVKNQHYLRMGHRVIALQHHILIFGGITPSSEYNPVTLKLDCQTMSVDVVPTRNALRLQGFSLFSHNHQIYFWAGSAPLHDNPKLSVCKNTLTRFTGDAFEEVPQTGHLPAPREYHTSCFFKNRYLIVMGGNNGRTFFNDWHILDCTNMRWTQILTNLTLPPTLNPLIFWHGGRGFLLTGETFDPQARQVVPDNQIYSFRFTDFKQKCIDIQPLTVSTHAPQRTPRGSPVAVFAPLESPYVILVGGEVPSERGVMGFCKTVDCFNVETLEWHAIELAPQAACGFQAAYINEKIYLIGGTGSNRQANQCVEFIDLKIDFIEARVCKICRQLYGMKELTPSDKSMNIKFEALLTSRTFFNSQIIGRMASYINYPFSAIGLLIDNSLNLSATNIHLAFQPNTTLQPDPTLRPFLSPDKLQPYDYITLTDNSFGFNQNEILECLCSFTLKTEKLTGDKRFEEEIQIRKEYGVNLKLGALRLGKSCLYTTKTEDGARLLAYFSCAGQPASEFTIYSYFLNPDGSCTSDINRSIIHHNVRESIPLDYERINTTTALYIFDIPTRELLLSEDDNQQQEVCHQESANKIYRYLQDYLESLYLVPFTGRRIAVNQREVKFRSYLDIFRKDQIGGKIVRLQEEYPKEFFNVFNIYRVVAKNYLIGSLLVYHKNRLIFAMNGFQGKFCGVLELSDRIKVDICKTKIQNRSEEVAFLKIVRNIIHKHEQKRISQTIITSNPVKYKNINSSSPIAFNQPSPDPSNPTSFQADNNPQKGQQNKK